MKIDWWYGKKDLKKCGVTVSFYPNDGKYRGIIYHEGKCVGDFVSESSTEIEKVWPEIFK